MFTSKLRPSRGDLPSPPSIVACLCQASQKRLLIIKQQHIYTIFEPKRLLLPSP